MQLQVIWDMLYTEDSAADQCTLYQLRNLINRRNVPKDPKQDVNATEDFLQLVTDAHIVAAAGKELGSQDGNTIPESAFQHVGQLSSDEKRAYLMKNSLSIVDNYMLPLSPCASLASSDSEEQDHVLNYAKILLTLGMIHRYFCDSVREGDGDRVLMCWKMLLLLFKQDGITKYALEAFLLLAHDSALLSAQMAYQLRWGR